MSALRSYAVDNKTVSEVIGLDIVYEIPNFQRKYAWTKREVSALTFDLYEDLDWTQSDLQGSTSYFLGSIVIAIDTLDSTKQLVLDGQQRLATISLMLSVLKQRLSEQKSDATSDIDRFLKKISFNIGEEKKLKLKLQYGDVDIYKALVRDPELCKSREIGKHLLAQATRTIFAEVDSYLKRAENDGVGAEKALLLMVKRIVDDTTFVKIVSPSESDAFRLFETLNDRGLALNAADLIKNKLLSKCAEKNLTSEAVNVWRDIIDFVGEEEAVDFLRYYWIAFHGNVRKRELYKVFEEHLRKLNSAQQALVFAKQIRASAKTYKHLAEPFDSKSEWTNSTGQVLNRLEIFSARSCKPVLMICAKERPNDLYTVAKACEAVTVRHTIVSRFTSNELEKSYAQFARSVRENKGTTVELLSRELSRHALTDEDFSKNFSEILVSRISDTWRQILIQLNERLSTGETSVRDAQSVHVEHILPKSPYKRALQEAGLNNLSKDEVASLTNSIGNLTLLSAPLNREISNSPFSAKLYAFRASEIALNKAIAECNTWGATEIKERSKELGSLATEVWAWPID